MTDKLTQTQELSRSLCQEQIIIDGVDVSKCEFYNPYYCGMYIDGYGDSEGVCRDYEDCCYKQLARKTQECKEREQDAENWAYKAGLATGKASRYRKALEEIEGVTKELKQNICDNCGWHNTDGCNPCGNVCGDLIQILDIISKAKENKQWD